MGVGFVGLPVAAAAGYGPKMGVYIGAAVACGVSAAVGLLLRMLLAQASSGLAPEEVAEMVAANHAASQQRVLELELTLALTLDPNRSPNPNPKVALALSL